MHLSLSPPPRLKKELKALLESPPPYIPAVAVDDRDMTAWHFLMRGPPDTPYEGGWYVGRVRFPPDYPFKPPALFMVTPSGRFATGVSICTSMSEFHPESWSCSWSVATILKGFLSFMCEDGPAAETTGAVSTTAGEKHALAAASLAWNLAAPGKLGDLFPILARAAAGEDVGPAGGVEGKAEGGGGVPDAPGPSTAAEAPPPPPPPPPPAQAVPSPAVPSDLPPPPPLRVGAADLAAIATAAAEAAAGEPAAGAARLVRAVKAHTKKGVAAPPDLVMAAARAVAACPGGDLRRAASLAGEAAGAGEDAPAGAAASAASLRAAAADLEAGSAAATTGDHAAALAAFDRVLGATPETAACSAAAAGRAAALAGLGRAGEAADAWAAARAADPDLGAAAARAHAAALREDGREKEAGAVLEAARLGGGKTKAEKKK